MPRMDANCPSDPLPVLFPTKTFFASLSREKGLSTLSYRLLSLSDLLSGRISITSRSLFVLALQSGGRNDDNGTTEAGG